MTSPTRLRHGDSRITAGRRHALGIILREGDHALTGNLRFNFTFRRALLPR